MKEILLDYVKPELVVVAVALYLVGIGLKKTERVSDKYIPIVLGAMGIVLALIYILAASMPISGAEGVLMAVFTAVIQGILCAGLSTYANQIWKQLGKKES